MNKVKRIIKLIRNENLKNISQSKTMIIFIIVLVSILGTALLNNSSDLSNKGWREEQAKEIKRLEKSIEENNKKIQEINDDKKSQVYKITIDSYKKRISLLKYSLEKNIPIDVDTPWKFVYDVKPTVNILILFILILSIHCITKEYSYGTVKQIFIRPYKRWKIVLCKYCSIIYISFLSLVVHFIISIIVGYLFFSKNGNGVTEILMSDDLIIERNVVSYVIQNYLFIFIKTVVLSSLAIMLAILIKKSTIPMILTLLLWMGSGAITEFTKKYWISKFLLFPHLNLTQYIPGESVSINGNTMSMSITVLVLYFLTFNFISYFLITKQDIY